MSPLLALSYPLPHGNRYRTLPPVAATLAAAWFLHLALYPADIVAALLWIAASGLLSLATAYLLNAVDLTTRVDRRYLAILLPCVGIEVALVEPATLLAGAASLMALTAAVNRCHRAMLFWFGMSLAFHAQAALLFPFALAVLIHRRIPLHLWLIAPLVVAPVITALTLAGWPQSGLAGFGAQALSLTDLSMGAPTLWAIVNVLITSDTPPLLGLAVTASIGAVAAYIARFSALPLHRGGLMPAALLSLLITAGLMPYMAAHCFFLANIIALVGAVSVTDRERLDSAMLLQAGSMLALLAQATGAASFAAVGAIPVMVATWRVARPLLQPAANDNPLLQRRV